jgi:Protein glycosylation ligase
MQTPATPASGDMASSQWRPAWGRSVVMVALLLPWVNPFAPFPSPPVVQSLLSVVGLSLLLLLPLKHDGVTVLAHTNASVWLGAALLSCVLALIQYFGASAAWFPWINGTAGGEAFANLRQRNQFATLTSIGLFALIWLQVCGRPQALIQTQRRLPALVASPAPAWAAAALLAVGNALSSSRTGLLQLLMMSALLLGCRSWRQAQVPTAGR